MNKIIYEFIEDICDNLHIKKPRIKISKKEFIGNTQMAAYNYKNRILYLKKLSKYENVPDVLFAIAHELRHKYQLDNHIFNFENYKIRSKMSVREYNLQFEEIDANAYACFAMEDLFEMKPLFNGLDEDIKDKIYKRADDLAAEL